MGVIPAYGMLDPPLIFPLGKLILWSLALAFIGVFCAVPLRTQTILKEKLKFPSGELTCLSPLVPDDCPWAASGIDKSIIGV